MPQNRTRIELTCRQCGSSFTAIPANVKRGAKYCSPECSRLSMFLPADRIWQRGVRTATGCFEWTGNNVHGYGRVSIGGTTRMVTHVAWELTYGPIPEGLYVLHHCDNPPCFEPTHLFVGTARDNGQDMSRKGRSGPTRHPERMRRGDSHPARLDGSYLPRGENNKASKLTGDIVRAIRQRYAAGGISQQALADEYGITQTCVGDVIRRKNWKHCD